MQALYANDTSWLDSAGRLIIAGFFVAVFLRNMTGNHVKNHIDLLGFFGAPFPAAVFWIGETLSLVGVTLLVFNYYPAIGALCLIVFIVLATALLLRFWQVDDPIKRYGMQNGFLANIAILGGLLLLLQNVR